MTRKKEFHVAASKPERNTASTEHMLPLIRRDDGIMMTSGQAIKVDRPSQVTHQMNNILQSKRVVVSRCFRALILYHPLVV
jgi:hypothetical protein